MPWVIAVANQKGGTGKSSVARALASYLVKQGGRIAVIDCDTQQYTVALWNVTRGELHKSNARLVVHQGAFTEDMIRRCGDVDGVIIDVEGRASVATVELARLSTLVVVPMKGTADDVRPTLSLVDQLVEQAGVPRERFLFVLSRIDSEAEERELRAQLLAQGDAVAKGALFNQPGYVQAANNGLTMVEVPYERLRKQAVTVMESIALRLADLLGQEKSSASARGQKGQPERGRAGKA